MIIRQLREQDLTLRDKFLSLPEISAGITIDLPISNRKSANWFEHASVDPNRIDFSFIHNNNIVGFGGLVNIKHKHKLAELYIFIGPEHQGFGLGKNGLKLMLEFAAIELGLRKIYLYATANNIAAIKLYEGAGFRLEGTLKNHIWHRGNYVDRHIYSIFLETITVDPRKLYSQIL